MWGSQSKRRARGLIALVVVLAAATGRAPAAPAASGGTDPATARRFIERTAPPGTWRMHRDRGGRNPAIEGMRAPPTSFLRRRVTDEKTLRNSATLTGALREALKAATGTRIPDLAAIVGQRRSQQRTAADQASTETDDFVIAGGDFDGDGHADAIHFTFTYDTETYDLIDASLVARRGADGAELWRRDIRDIDDLIVPEGDIDGDGRDDLVLIHFNVHTDGLQDQCVPFAACVITEDATYTWTIEMTSGASGAAVWQKSYEGHLSAAGAFDAAPTPTWNDLAAVDGTNLLVFPILGGDYDGDGHPDLVVDSYDVTLVFGFHYAGALVADALVVESAFLESMRGEVLDGEDGRQLFARATDKRPDDVALLPMGDAVGDPTPDLLLTTARSLQPVAACVFALVGSCAARDASALSIEVIDGASHATAWTVEVEPHGYVVPAGVDLNGDGAEDVVSIQINDDFEFETTAISGANGSTMWTRAGMLFASIGARPGTTHQLVLVIEDNFFEASTDLEIRFIRLDGADGSEVFRTTQAISLSENSALYADIFPLDDADGDGALELVTQYFTYDYGTEAVTTGSTVESGAQGRVLLDRVQDGIAYVVPGGDMDGDGLTELIDLTLSLHRLSVDVTARDLDVLNGSSSWTTSNSYFADSYLSIDPIGDVAGDGGDDAIINAAQFTNGTFEMQADVVEQRTGETLWSLGDVLTAPPAPGSSAIAGTITTDGGEPAYGACAHAVRIDGADFGYAYTRDDGSYLVNELPAGDYKIEFADCWGGYIPEWYNSQPSFETADVVVVPDATTVAGIDGSLTVYGEPPTR